MPKWLLILIEIVCVGVFLVGIAMFNIPLALIIGGALGVWACETPRPRPKTGKAKR